MMEVVYNYKMLKWIAEGYSCEAMIKNEREAIQEARKFEGEIRINVCDGWSYIWIKPYKK